MSADNWRRCPNCIELLANERTALTLEIQQSYGEVSEGEYIDLLLEQSKLQEEELAHTLREDWEIGIRNGVFNIWYGACCEVCGFSHKFNHQEDV